jgi:hypothetical protein
LAEASVNEGDGIMKILVILLCTAAVTGCAVNGFAKYYAPAPGVDSSKIPTNPVLEHPKGEIRVFASTGDVESDGVAMVEHGYARIGVSSFYGPAQTQTRDMLLKQAKAVHADAVVLFTQYRDTLSGVRTLTFVGPPTTTTTVAAASNGFSAGAAAASVTTPGSVSTSQIPYSIDRNNVVATYWVKLDMSRIRLGAVSNPLPEDLRTKLQRNTGIVVYAVQEGSPAFRANVLRGDIILKINGEDVIDVASFQKDQLTKFAGQGVVLGVLRNEKPVDINVHLNSNPPQLTASK